MQTVLTPDVLKTMSCDEFEDWRDSGEDYRRELTHAVLPRAGTLHASARQLPRGGVQPWCDQSCMDGGVRARQRSPVLRGAHPEGLPD